MAMPVEIPESETRKLIQAAMAKRDSFRVRVARRKNSNTGLEVVASFEEARGDHIVSPEKWLPELAGGGNYYIDAFHADDPVTQIGGSVLFSVGGNSWPAAWSVIDSPNWRGPSECSYPTRPVAAQRQSPVLHVPGQEQPIGVDVGGGVPISTPITRDRGPDNQLLLYMDKAQRAEAASAAMVADAARRSEMESIRRESDKKLDAAERRYETLMAEVRALQQRPPEQPKESIVDSLGKLAPLLMPLLQTVLTNQNNAALKQAELAAHAAERQLVAAKESAESVNKILTMMMTRPAIDPVILTLLQESMKQKETSPMVAEMASAFTSMSQGFLQTITAATDAGLINRPNEGGGMAEVVGALGGVASSFIDLLAQRQQQGPGVQLAQPRTVEGERVVSPALPMPRVARPDLQQQRRPVGGVPGQHDALAAWNSLDRYIKARTNPQQVAVFFLDQLAKDPVLQQRFRSAGTDLTKFYAAYWQTWTQSNMPLNLPYAQALQDAVVAEARRRGMVPQEQQPAAAVEVQQQPEPGDMEVVEIQESTNGAAHEPEGQHEEEEELQELVEQ